MVVFGLARAVLADAFEVPASHGEAAEAEGRRARAC